MRRFLALLVALLAALCLVGCGKNAIEGSWQYVSGDTSAVGDWDVPYSLTFQKGKLTIDVDFSQTGMSEADVAFDRQMLSLSVFTYQVASNSEIKITVSVENLSYSETKTFSYKVEGDTLTLDGATFTRK